MELLSLIAGIAFVGIGILGLAKPDLMWSWQKFANDLSGQDWRRTEAWESRRVAGNVVAIAMGVLLLGIFLNLIAREDLDSGDSSTDLSRLEREWMASPGATPQSTPNGLAST